MSKSQSEQKFAIARKCLKVLEGDLKVSEDARSVSESTRQTSGDTRPVSEDAPRVASRTRSYILEGLLI